MQSYVIKCYKNKNLISCIKYVLLLRMLPSRFLENNRLHKMVKFKNYNNIGTHYRYFSKYSTTDALVQTDVHSKMKRNIISLYYISMIYLIKYQRCRCVKYFVTSD